MDAALVGLAGTVIGAIAAVGGGFATQVWSERSAQRQWLRNRRAESGEEFLSLLTRLCEVADQQTILHDQGEYPPYVVEGHRVDHEGLRALADQISILSGRLTLYYPQDTRTSAWKASLRFSNYVWALFNTSHEGGEEVLGYNQRSERFLEEADNVDGLLRRDLGLD